MTVPLIRAPWETQEQFEDRKEAAEERSEHNHELREKTANFVRSLIGKAAEDKDDE